MLITTIKSKGGVDSQFFIFSIIDLISFISFSVHEVSPENVFEPISDERLFLTAIQIAIDFFFRFFFKNKNKIAFRNVWRYDISCVAESNGELAKHALRTRQPQL